MNEVWSGPGQVDRAPPVDVAGQRLQGQVPGRVDEHELTVELGHWRRDLFPLLGELLGLHWLSTEEAVSAAPAAFGMEATTSNDGTVRWRFVE